MSALSGLVNLLNLDFERCPWMHGGLVHLKGLSKLQPLNFNCCNCIDDADMEPLPELPNLKQLQLCSTKVTDHGVVFLKVILGIYVRTMELLGPAFIKIFGSDPSCADYLKVLIESLFSNTGHNHHFADLFHMVLIDSRKR
ncbi:hypothetical protein L1987_63591 [Smallanthus sonchifolius]|uniref:Uncharacterized protein n=1 Tax=Smallanthus sonchifolius TaxID=185202 RepID=A0ACB9CDQ1_9ASTR|nr:hypothetical protein L1987_63591 [Smallanthus sonchifolius]